jgi:DNA-binding response OmpR family regulator
MEKKVLLIDDDEDLLRSFQVILEYNGFQVVTATDGKIGFAKLKEEHPDLVVLDVMMNSNLEGYNLLHTIKKDTENKKLPIILLTGMRDQLGVNLYSGVEDESLFPNVRYLDKPIDPLLLVEQIKAMLK